MIAIEGLFKAFGRLPVLAGIDYTFRKGKVYALIGPNASGKTTLIKCILGLVTPDRGRVLFDGRPVAGASAYRSRIGYMPQISSFPDTMTVRQVIDMIVRIRQGTAAQPGEDAFGLAPFLSNRMSTLSGGTRQKVNADLALRFDAEVLILDEPTAGLDPLSAGMLKERIQRERSAGKLVIVTTHNIADIDELADEVVYLQSGTIRFSKTADELRAVSGNHSTDKGIRHFMRHENV